jgi:hypothetical protein
MHVRKGNFIFLRPMVQKLLNKNCFSKKIQQNQKKSFFINWGTTLILLETLNEWDLLDMIL